MPARLLVDLVLATLATYQYPLDRAWALRDALVAAGLTTPDGVLGRSVGDVGNALKDAGYDRGGVTYIIAPRLISLMQAVADGALDALPAAVHAGDEAGFRATLERVKGFGPKGSGLAWQLASADGG